MLHSTPKYIFKFTMSVRSDCLQLQRTADTSSEETTFFDPEQLQLLLQQDQSHTARVFRKPCFSSGPININPLVSSQEILEDMSLVNDLGIHGTKPTS